MLRDPAAQRLGGGTHRPAQRRRLPVHQPRERERAWLFRIARNAAIDHRRRAAVRPRAVREMREPTTAPVQALRSTLVEALGRLPDTEREAFLLDVALMKANAPAMHEQVLGEPLADSILEAPAWSPRRAFLKPARFLNSGNRRRPVRRSCRTASWNCRLRAASPCSEAITRSVLTMTPLNDVRMVR